MIKFIEQFKVLNRPYWKKPDNWPLVVWSGKWGHFNAKCKLQTLFCLYVDKIAKSHKELEWPELKALIINRLRDMMDTITRHTKLIKSYRIIDEFGYSTDKDKQNRNIAVCVEVVSPAHPTTYVGIMASNIPTFCSKLPRGKKL